MSGAAWVSARYAPALKAAYKAGRRGGDSIARWPLYMYAGGGAGSTEPHAMRAGKLEGGGCERGAAWRIERYARGGLGGDF
jgi:hypothetical protein